jgi:hypothetical protein
LLTMAANAIMFDMQLHAAKYNGACHLPPRWYVMKYWAALACYSGMVQPRVAWHWGGAKAVSIPCCPELCRPNGMASNTGRHSHREYATSLAHAMSSNNIASRRHRSSYCPVPARTVYIPCRPCMTLGLYSIWRHRIVPPQCRTLPLGPSVSPMPCHSATHDLTWAVDDNQPRLPNAMPFGGMHCATYWRHTLQHGIG